MNEKKFKEKLVEFLIELGKPKRYEVGYVQGNKIINDGLSVLGLNAMDILGFSKSASDNRVRKTKGAQAWFKKMYESGWKYVANFEQEGLLTNGFAVMERELPNETLNVIKQELEALLKDGTEFVPIKKISIVAKDIPEDLMKMREEYIHKIKTKPMSGYVGEDMLRAEGKIPKTIKEPREGFDSEVNDFIIDSQKEPKSYEDIFFEQTGKNAVWHGKQTIAFKKWLEGLD